MSITINPYLENKLRPSGGGRLTVEAYLERLARDDQQAEEELEALALEGLQSGESVVADETYWAEKRRRLIERHQNIGIR